MKLSKLKEIIDQCAQYAGDCDPDVEIWIGDKKAYRIGRIGQYGVIPNVLISVGEKLYDSTAPLEKTSNKSTLNN